MNLSGHDFICFALRAWSSPWKNNQQLMSRLAASNRVLYVNPPRSLRAALTAAKNGFDRQGSVVSTDSNLYVLQEPFLLPRWGRGHAVARLFNRGVDPARILHVKRTADLLRLRDIILWIYDPLAGAAIGRFGERVVVYHVIDNYRDYFGFGDAAWRAAFIASHDRMLKQADMVIAVSESLYRDCLRANPNSFLVPNGVDLQIFQGSFVESIPEIERIPGPVIGFVGVVHGVVDLGLLEYVATQRPRWSLMLVGPVEALSDKDRTRFSHLIRLPNVHHFGFQPPHRLPAFIARCDVTLMPYRLGPLTEHGDSLKLYEYMACGKPVVSTDILSARKFGHLIEIAQTPEEFLQAIERSLQEAPERPGDRKREAMQHSWSRRVEAIGAILKEQLDRRAGNGGVGLRTGVSG